MESDKERWSVEERRREAENDVERKRKNEKWEN